MLFGAVMLTVLFVQSKSPLIVLPPLFAVTFVSETEPLKMLPPHATPTGAVPPPIVTKLVKLLKLELPLTLFPQNVGRLLTLGPPTVMPPSIPFEFRVKFWAGRAASKLAQRRASVT